MGIKRYVAYKDNTITNAFEENLTTRATSSNSGQADSLEVFSIFAQANSSSNEQARILVQFPCSSRDTNDYPDSGLVTIEADRAAGKIPASGSVNFFLKLYNVATDQTVPTDFTLVVKPVSGAAAVGKWEEGYGVDLDTYTDITYGSTGSNWVNRSANTAWSSTGGDYLTTRNYEKFFSSGIEDLEIDITDLVEDWINDTNGIPNGGVGIMLTASQESGSVRSYYTKRFSARGSEYYFNRPVIEARWDSSQKDNRGNFFASSPSLSTADNSHTIYFYNYFRGQPKNLPGVGTGSVYVRVYDERSEGTEITATPVTGGFVSTGVYSASLSLDTHEEVVFDRWFSGSTYFHTGSIKVKEHYVSDAYYIPKYITTITNMQPSYCKHDLNRFRVFTRLKNWNVTSYTVSQMKPQVEIVDDAYFKVFRTIDHKTVISYGTGSINHTRLSYDVSGSYFDLDMSLLQPGFEYGFRFVYYINGAYEEQPESFTFRVE